MTSIQGHAGLLMGGVLAPQYFNPSKKGTDIVLSNGNKTAASTLSSPAWESVFALLSNPVGTNLYLEFLFTTASNSAMFGLGNTSATIGSYCGSDANGWGLQSANARYHSGANLGTWATVSTGQVVGIALSSAGTVYAAVNNSWAGGGTPGSGATALFTGLSGTIFPIASIISTGITVTLRVSNSDFSYTPPAGYSSWSGH